MKPRLQDGCIEPLGENPEEPTFREPGNLKLDARRLLLAAPRIVFSFIVALITAAAAG